MPRERMSDGAIASEGGNFRRSEEAQLDQLRSERERAANRRRLAEATGVTDQRLLARVEALGLTAETVVLIDLLPAIEVAWAERVLTQRERDAVVSIAAELGVAGGEPAFRQLLGYLTTPPDEEFFAEARDVLAALVETMPSMEGQMRRMDAIDFCSEVARASGGLLARFGLRDTVSSDERDAIRRVSARLCSGRGSNLASPEL